LGSGRGIRVPPPVQVAGHHVGAAGVDFLCATVPEVKDTAVFQEPAHDAAHGDVVADPGDTRTEAAEAADEQIHFHAGAGRLIEEANHAFILKGIHFKDQVAVFAVGDLPPDQFDEAAPHSDRGDQEPAKIGLMRVTGQVVEKIGGVGADVGIGGEQAKIRVETGGSRVVVAGARWT